MRLRVFLYNNQLSVKTKIVLTIISMSHTAYKRRIFQKICRLCHFTHKSLGQIISYVQIVKYIRPCWFRRYTSCCLDILATPKKWVSAYLYLLSHFVVQYVENDQSKVFYDQSKVFQPIRKKRITISPIFRQISNKKDTSNRY